ncbi:MAG: TIGR04141 family sporadically distributed protein [Phycisphaerales bacterium]
MKYTIYVFKDSVKNLDDAMAPSSLGKGGYTQVAVTGVTFPVTAYFQSDKTTVPSWLEYVLPHCAIPKPKTVLNRSNSLVVILKTTSGRVCALTYGQGFMALEKTFVQEDFGLEAACRLLEANTIKEIESKAVGFDGLHKLQIASKPGDLATFPLQRARDHVHRLGGKSNDPALGKRITGATSCMIGGIIPFTELQLLCDGLVAAIAKKPKARLAALKRYERVVDATVTQALDGKLLAALKPVSCKEIGLFLPEAEDWRSVHSFEVSWTDDQWEPLEDLDVEAIVAGARAAHGASLKLDQLNVRGLHEKGSVVVEQPLSHLATFQTHYNGKPYALKDGKWYRLDQQYIDDCKAAFIDIDIESDPNYLPPWTGSGGEGKYNDGVAKKQPDRFCALDRKGVDADGNAVEACDLVSEDGHFIHVKAWKSSQTFSALIKQGENSAQLIAGSQPFRDAVLAKIPAKWKSKAPWKDFSTGVPTRQLRIVYAIADAPTKTLPDDLPFFSRLSLYDGCAALRAKFFDVRVCHIERKKGAKAKKAAKKVTKKKKK